MKNSFGLIVLCIVILSCKDKPQEKNQCLKFANTVGERITDTLNFEDIIDSNYRSKLVKIDDVDTLYRYRKMGGWTKFDYICSIYKQKDTPQYKAQVLKREEKQDDYTVSSKTIDLKDWLFIKNKFDSSHFWCYEYGSPRCIDCGYDHVICKVSNLKRLVSLNNVSLDSRLLKSLAMDILDVNDNNLFSSMIFCKPQRDSLKLQMYLEPHNLWGLVDTGYFDGISKTSFDKIDGMIHKKDASLLKDIELVLKFHNGKIIRTTEKEIRYQ